MFLDGSSADERLQLQRRNPVSARLNDSPRDRHSPSRLDAQNDS